MMKCPACLCLLLALALPARAANTSPHKTQLVRVAKDVKLEVLDWGGNGPPLLFLAGWGNTAHIFDRFAPHFLAHHHVHGITRRGFGASGSPPATLENYDSDRLADDVLAVMATLKRERPILAGHSMAGQEMSSIATRFPSKVSGLIYLEAAWAFAFYDPKGGYNVQVEADSMRRELEQLLRADGDPKASRELIDRIEEQIPLLRESLERDRDLYRGVPQPAGATISPHELAAAAMRAGRHKYQNIKVPLLALIADPWNCKPDCARPDQIAWSREIAAQARAVKADYPMARIVRIPYADHYIFRSNEADVLREMNAFMDALH